VTQPSFPSPTIGVFDSGFGGLTVLRALIARAPQARYAFIGDTARLPYGSKSRRTIARYAAQSARFLVEEQGADYLVIACNTASALALDDIKEAVPSSVSVIGVIEPGADAAHAASTTRDVLVIATDATVRSHAYAAACQARGLRALEKACPLLVPLVEEGWVTSTLNDPLPAQAAPAPRPLAVTAEVVRIYLDELLADAASQGLNPDTLVLGCTHYPLLKPVIERALPPGTKIIDSAESTAHQQVMLLCRDLAPPPQATETDPVLRFFATDSVEKFERLGSRFLGRPVGNVQLVDLGG
jgi:glutamate racemase